MRASFILAVLNASLLAGCDENQQKQPEPREDFPVSWCKYVATGASRTREHKQCYQVGKNPCGGQTIKKIPQTEHRIECAKVVWADKS